MEKSSKKQLQEIIKSQDEELQRYKLRFQDLVAAHKGLLKEKKTLETTLQVMRRAPTAPVISKSETEIPVATCSLTERTEKDEDKSINASQVPNPVTSSENEASPSRKINEKSGNEETVEHLRSQIDTLMQSLATLSEEKSRMEAGFQADKKALRSEKEERERVVKDLRKELNLSQKLHQNEIENYKSRIIIERHEREKEHHDHGVMIRELQKLLAEERSTREKAESVVEDIRHEFVTLQGSVEHKEKDLINQMESLKNRLVKERDTSTPMMATLKEELNVLKQQHLIDLQREQERVIEAEERTKSLAAMHETRVANLESRLAELSETVGTYDRRRQEDLQSIFKLKEKLVQMEVEQGDEKVKDNKEMDVLLDELKHLKKLIETANGSDKPLIDIYSVLFDQNDSVNLSKYTNADHTICNEEYRLLKEEFESYKQQVQANQLLYSPKNEKPSEVEPLKFKVKTLKENIHVLQLQLESAEKNYKQKLEECQKAIRNEKTRWQEKLSSCEQEHRLKIADLELQLTKQRERALALVNEKDEEITALKTSFHSLLPTPNTRLSQSSDKDYEAARDNSIGVDMVESRPMLHYVQELARLQVDIKKLRKQKHALESALRDEQLGAAEEREYLNVQINKLSEDVARFERYQTREGANLEYLKNVVLSYLLTSDEKMKSHMLNAIAAVLQFSDSEKIKVSHTTHHKVTPIH